LDRRYLIVTGSGAQRHGRSSDLQQDSPQRAERFDVLLETPELLILRNDNNGRAPRGEQVLMAGQIVSNSTVLEIVNLIASSRWAGTLHLYGTDSHRLLGFYNGVLRYAESDHPEDRLDKVLRRIGVLRPAQVEQVMRGIKPDQRFGELLIEHGLVERKELFTYLGRQIEQILLAAVLEDQGTYTFLVSDEAGPPPAATAHIPLQSLLLDAAERVDKLSIFSQLVPDSSMCPEVRDGVDVAQLDPRQRLVLGYCDGKRSLREIGSETWLGRFQTLEITYQLLRGGQIQLCPPQLSPAQQAAELIEPFNQSLVEIYEAIESSGQADRVRRDLATWIGEQADSSRIDDALASNGLVSVEAIANVLRESASRHVLADLHASLHELTSFALFSASLWLMREEEQDLSRRIHSRLKKAKG